jgi:hypothetical protein
MVIGISTVHRRAGLLHDKIVKHLGQDDDNVLSILAPSTAFNPLLLDAEAQAEIDRQMALDPEAAAAEWLSRWRDDLSDMFDPALVAQAVDQGRRILFPRSSVTYTMAVDPSGGRGDAFTAAVGHREDELIVIDRVVEWRAPFDIDVVMDAVAELAHDYRICTVHHDDYGADLVVAGFRRRGLISKSIAIRDQGRDYKLNRSEIYLDALPAFTAGRVRLPDEPRLVHQLVSLERRPSNSGRDIVDHPRSKGSHDDLANSCCAAITLLATKQTMRVSAETLAASRNPSALRIAGISQQEFDNMTLTEKLAAGRSPAASSRGPLGITEAILQRAAVPGPWSGRHLYLPGGSNATGGYPLGGTDQWAMLQAGRDR